MHSSLDSSMVHDSGNIDSESHPRNPTHRRSKRRRKTIGKSSLTLPAEPKQTGMGDPSPMLHQQSPYCLSLPPLPQPPHSVLALVFVRERLRLRKS
ncbi:hypothetical protein ACFX2G_027892 [Malus domestica]